MPVWIEIGGWFRRNENGPDEQATAGEVAATQATAVEIERLNRWHQEWATVEDAAAAIVLDWPSTWSFGLVPQVLAVDSETGNELADITPTPDGQVRIVPHQHEVTP